jgi:hypothetical protein
MLIVNFSPSLRLVYLKDLNNNFNYNAISYLVKYIIISIAKVIINLIIFTFYNLKFYNFI